MTEAGLWNIAKSTPDAVAVVDAFGGRLTYRELAARADRFGRGLQAMGMVAGDALVMVLPNTVDTLAVYFAAMQTGVYVVAVNWHLTGPEIAYIISHSGARVLVAHERFAGVTSAAADESGLPAGSRFAVGHIDGFRALDDLGADEPPDRPDPRTLGTPMLYTSGTTGKPKGVRRPLTGADPDAVPFGAIGFFSRFALTPFDGHVHICGSPLYHTAVLNFSAISVQLGHKVVLMDTWDAEEMLRLIEQHRVTHSHMVPTQFRRLLALPEDVRAKYDVSSLRNMVHGAAPCPPEVKRRMLAWWGPVVTEYYAATEGGGTTITAQERLQRPGSVGRAWPYSVVKVLDDDGNELAPGGPGTVYMQMAGSSFTYHNDEKKTAESRAGGLFTVGDVGYLDEDGYLFLQDRKSNMIISGGVNVYPAEIENELIMHPKVADVAVLGVPDHDWGEQIKAVVQPADGVVGDDAVTAELLDYARRRLAKFKLPRSIDYIAEMPRDPNGKLYKTHTARPLLGRARSEDLIELVCVAERHLHVGSRNGCQRMLRQAKRRKLFAVWVVAKPQPDTARPGPHTGERHLPWCLTGDAVAMRVGAQHLAPCHQCRRGRQPTTEFHARNKLAVDAEIEAELAAVTYREIGHHLGEAPNALARLESELLVHGKVVDERCSVAQRPHTVGPRAGRVDHHRRAELVITAEVAVDVSHQHQDHDRAAGQVLAHFQPAVVDELLRGRGRDREHRRVLIGRPDFDRHGKHSAGDGVLGGWHGPHCNGGPQRIGGRS
ncbi:MAG: long-chain acyl-CoA synthetase [Mycobacterium sp.]|nr:fadD4 4 [Mycobacterium sp.]MDT5132368.1 long-chain acyl-CoA synthetase [Mycobacterium sp.]